MLEVMIYILTGLIALLIPAVYIFRERQKSKRAHTKLDHAIKTGRDQPISLHPYINPDSCIGSGACVKACPEKDVLGLINNRGKLINPSSCIGHGLCQAACPVDAIDLVIGTEKKGVDIPHISGRFETNVQGIYIAGELGGMGLIRNAVEQGRQAVKFLAEGIDENTNKGEYDLLIVGAGPAGISASLQAKKENLKFITIDQDGLGGTILNYPRKKLVMTYPMDLPVYGRVKVREIFKEDLLALFRDVFDKTDVSVHSGIKVDSITGKDGDFSVVTKDKIYSTKKVLLAIGRRGTPRKLNVPGEETSKVAYKLGDADDYKGNILVVGGGDSAVEAATALGNNKGNRVTLSYRGDTIYRIKEGNKDKLDDARLRGSVKLLYNSNVKEIREKEVILVQKEKMIELENDYVFIMVGGELPTEFLKNIGINFSRKFGEKLGN